MDILWSPWRSKYIDTFKDEEKKRKESCFLCEAANNPDRDAELLVVARCEKVFAMLNKFPYNNGHMLISPYRHIGELDGLTEQEMAAMMMLIRESCAALKEAYQPHGFNIGMNAGRNAGAGVPEHIHMHIVPRWDGDTNFMAVFADVKVVSQSLEDTQRILSEIFAKNK
ncbi:MAG: HIT family protein [Candidatus Kapaibacterium sp.]